MNQPYMNQTIIYPQPTHHQMRIKSYLKIVIATTSFPTHTKEELSYMQKADPTIKEFLKFWEKGMKPTLGERKKLSHHCASLLRQWD